MVDVNKLAEAILGPVREKLAEIMRDTSDAFEALAKRIDALESRVPERGEKGDPGADGVPGRDGKDGESPSPESVALAMEPQFAKWALDFERRAQDLFQRAIDRMPTPKDGKDGKSFDGKVSKTTEDLGDGRVVHRWFIGGEQIDQHEERAFADRGVFKEGAEYWRNNAVTFGGSLWLAQKDAPEGKPGLSPDWRLAVKKGRDA